MINMISYGAIRASGGSWASAMVLLELEPGLWKSKGYP